MLLAAGATVSLATIAAEYFLWNVQMTYEEDQSSNFTSTQNWLRTSQPVMNAAGKWRAGDLFVVRYIDGTIAKFELSARGQACVGFGPLMRCQFVTTLPLNDPEVVIHPPAKAALLGLPTLPGAYEIPFAFNHPLNLNLLVANIINAYAALYTAQLTFFISAGGPIPEAPPAGGGGGGGGCSQHGCKKVE